MQSEEESEPEFYYNAQNCGLPDHHSVHIWHDADDNPLVCDGGW